MKRLKTIILSIASIIALNGIGFLNSATAIDDQTTESEDTAPHLVMSPITTHVELEPNKTYHGSFKIGNNGTYPFSFKVYADPYQETDDSGSVNYVEQTRYTKIVDWITFDTESGEISPDGYEIINYTVKVPENPPAGGQYAALVVEAENSNDKKESAIKIETVSRIAHILYAQISGENNYCSEIIENKVSTFLFTPPFVANTVVDACGNIDFELSQTLKVYSFFDGKEIFSNEQSPLKRNVLPGNRRASMVSWGIEEGAPSIGLYRVEHIVTFGDKTSIESNIVIVVPLWVLVICSAFIVSLAIWIIIRIRSHRKNKKILV